MKYPIVEVKTEDGLILYGLLSEAKSTDRIVINVHGTASNFYDEPFLKIMFTEFPKKDLSFLSTNNRGAYAYDAYQKSGAAVEKFEDCVIDINSWIEFSVKRGYKEIILMGHSLGTEKVVYYMSKGKYKNKVIGIILLAPADSYGSHRWLEGKPNLEGRRRVDFLLKDSVRLLNEDKRDFFLPRNSYGSREGIMPKTSESFINFLGPDSELLNALPFHTKKLQNYSKIKVPILVAIGDEEEYTAIPIEDALDLMKKENSLTETHQFKDCDHDFYGKEKELTSIVVKFLEKLK